jgi:hypothetical protein
VSDQEERNKAVSGKTYSLYGDGDETDKYYRTVKKLIELFLHHCPDKKRLLFHVRIAGSRAFSIKRTKKNVDRSLLSLIKNTLKDSLSIYTTGVKPHLKNLPFSLRFDKTLRTKEEQYHLYMLEIELVNRIYKEDFKSRKYKIALLPHCLHDFRAGCRSVPGDIEAICKGCTKECFINLGSQLLKEYDIHPYISVTMDLEKLFMKLKAEHPSISALGIACIPELANGMRLCIKLNIPPVGIPLDANRCSRWMKECRESSFNLKELEALLK